jgi:Helix-turn-helix domain
MMDALQAISVRPAYLRVQDAAAYCSCSAEYLAKETRKGTVAYIKKGRCVFYAVSDLDEWMNQDRVKAA